MRNLIKITSIGVLAVALTACGKKNKETTDPGGGTNNPTSGVNPANPAAATAEA